MDEDTVKRIGNEGIEGTTLWQGGNARVAKCSSYRLSATKHPLNNLPINSPGRLRHPLLIPLLLTTPLLLAYAFTVRDTNWLETCGFPSLSVSFNLPSSLSILRLAVFFTLAFLPFYLVTPFSREQTHTLICSLPRSISVCSCQ